MGIRYVLLQVAVFAISIFGLIDPRIALYGYIFYSAARPDALAWSEGQLPHSLIVGVITIVGAWRFVGNLRSWLINPWTFSLWALLTLMAASVVVSPFPNLAWPPFLNFLKYIAVALIIPLYIVTIRDFSRLMYVLAFSVGLVGFRFGVFGLRAGGIHIESGLGGFISDNNTLALALVTGLPILWHTRQTLRSRVLRFVVIIATFTTTAAIVMTHSRAGVLTLGVVILFFIWHSKRKLLAILGVTIILVPSVFLVYDSLRSRMATLEDVEQDSSASARLEYNFAALKMWRDNPVLGVGFGTLNWVALSPQYLGHSNPQQHVVHNNYLQMAVDSGVFALLVLIWQIFFSIWWLGRSAKALASKYSELAPYPRGLQGALVAFAFGSVFVSRTDYDLYYFLIMMVACWYTVDQTLPSRGQNLTKPEPAGTTLPTGSKRVPANPTGQVSSAVPTGTPNQESRWRTPHSPIRARKPQ